MSTYQKQSRHTHIHGVCFLSSYIVTLLSNPFNPILCGNIYIHLFIFILKENIQHFKKKEIYLTFLYFYGSFCPLGSGEPIESGSNPDPQHCLAVVPNLTGERTSSKYTRCSQTCRYHRYAVHCKRKLSEKSTCWSKRSIHVLKFKWKTAWNKCFGSRMIPYGVNLPSSTSNLPWRI